MGSIAFIQKAGGTTVVFVNGKPYTVEPSALNYKIIIKALEESDYDALTEALDIRKYIADYSNGKIEVFGSDVYYDKKLVKGALAERFVELLSKDMLITPYVNFMNKLYQNPLESAKEELFLFMESNNLPLTPDGDFLAYKAVTRSNNPAIDWTDARTKTISNRVGNVVEMPRDEVNPNRNEACAAGLHVCAYNYLGHYYDGHSNRLVVVKVNPKDVISVPYDYNNQKMRVCRYSVVDEIKEWGDTLPKNYTEDYPEYDENEISWDDSDDDSSEHDIEKPTVSELSPSSAKLTASDIPFIREYLDDGYSLAWIARKYNVSSRQIARIRDGEAWANA